MNPVGQVRQRAQWGAGQADSADLGGGEVDCGDAEAAGRLRFPFSGENLRHFVKSYQDLKGVSSRFKDNLPTDSWTGSWKGSLSSPCGPPMP